MKAALTFALLTASTAGPTQLQEHGLQQSLSVEKGNYICIWLVSMHWYTCNLDTLSFLPCAAKVSYFPMHEKVDMMGRDSSIIWNVSFHTWTRGLLQRVYLCWTIALYTTYKMFYCYAQNSKHCYYIHIWIALQTLHFSGVRLCYLPPYSPDLNPIEEAFSFVKSVLCRDGDLFRSAVASKQTQRIFFEFDCALAAITQEKAEGWMCHSGYLCSIH